MTDWSDPEALHLGARRVLCRRVNGVLYAPYSVLRELYEEGQAMRGSSGEAAALIQELRAAIAELKGEPRPWKDPVRGQSVRLATESGYYYVHRDDLERWEAGERPGDHERPKAADAVSETTVEMEERLRMQYNITASRGQLSIHYEAFMEPEGGS